MRVVRLPTISREPNQTAKNDLHRGDSARYSYLNRYSGNYNNYDYLYEYEEETDEAGLLAMPEVLLPQQCPRCENQFPGGLERCTACGLHVDKMRQQPEAALPWRGFDRGVIICPTCSFANADDLARRNRIQKCDQCGKTVYIPSGLYNRQKSKGLHFKRKRHLPNPLFELFDIVGAAWTRFMNSKAKWPVLLGLTILALTGLMAAYIYKQEINTPPKVTPPVVVYYNQVLPYESRLSNALDTFNQDSGGGGQVQKGDYVKWSKDSLDLTNSSRFVRNVDPLLNTVQDIIANVNSMPNVPPEAQDFHQKFLANLVAYQKYYARLKDGIKLGRIDLWNSAFDMQNELKDDVKAQNSAFEQLRQLVFTLDHGQQ